MTQTLGPGAYRLSAEAGRYRWRLGHEEVASAAWRDHCWDLRHDEGRAVLSVVGGADRGRTRVALVDHASRRTSTFASAEPMSRSHLGEVRDGEGSSIMAVRADGPTGLHVVDRAGDLLMIFSRRRDCDGMGSDVLVTDAGAGAGVPLLFGLTLALELLRAGTLRRVA